MRQIVAVLERLVAIQVSHLLDDAILIRHLHERLQSELGLAHLWVLELRRDFLSFAKTKPVSRLARRRPPDQFTHMVLDELEVVEAAVQEVVIKVVHGLPGAISNSHHDDTEWELAGVRNGVDRLLLVLAHGVWWHVHRPSDLAICDNHEDVVLSPCGVDNADGLVDDRRERRWTRHGHIPHDVAVATADLLEREAPTRPASKVREREHRMVSRQLVPKAVDRNDIVFVW